MPWANSRHPGRFPSNTLTSLAALAADYYPRLTGIVDDKTAAIHLINHQTEIALLLAGPVFLAMMALAPWVIRILYTASFLPAVEVLRWQILSDVLKIQPVPGISFSRFG